MADGRRQGLTHTCGALPDLILTSQVSVFMAFVHHASPEATLAPGIHSGPIVRVNIEQYSQSSPLHCSISSGVQETHWMGGSPGWARNKVPRLMFKQCTFCLLLPPFTQHTKLPTVSFH